MTDILVYLVEIEDKIQFIHILEIGVYGSNELVQPI
jgi:hypothetical protein